MTTPNTTCEYCGKPLETITVSVLGRSLDVPCYASCGCDESRRRYASISGKAPSMPEKTKYERAGIGRSYIDARTEAPTPTGNVFITGPNGTGKTVYASSLAMNLIDQGQRVQFANVSQALQRVRDEMDERNNGGEYWAGLCQSPWLVLDDLGKGNPTEWAVASIYNLVEYRNAENLPTIVTTNYNGGELVKRLSVNGDPSTAQAIVSRLVGGAEVVVMGGKDRRL